MEHADHQGPVLEYRATLGHQQWASQATILTSLTRYFCFSCEGLCCSYMHGVGKYKSKHSSDLRPITLIFVFSLALLVSVAAHLNTETKRVLPCKFSHALTVPTAKRRFLKNLGHLFSFLSLLWFQWNLQRREDMWCSSVWNTKSLIICFRTKYVLRSFLTTVFIHKIILQYDSCKRVLKKCGKL